MVVVESLSFAVGSIFLADAAYTNSKTRCHLSVDFVRDIICSIYIMMGWRYHKCCDNGVNLLCTFSQGVSDNSDPTVVRDFSNHDLC